LSGSRVLPGVPSLIDSSALLEQLFGRIREIPAWGTLLHDGRTTQSRSVAPRRLSTPKLPEIPEIRADPWSAPDAFPKKKKSRPWVGSTGSTLHRGSGAALLMLGLLAFDGGVGGRGGGFGRSDVVEQARGLGGFEVDGLVGGGVRFDARRFFRRGLRRSHRWHPRFLRCLWLFFSLRFLYRLRLFCRRFLCRLGLLCSCGFCRRFCRGFRRSHNRGGNGGRSFVFEVELGLGALGGGDVAGHGVVGVAGFVAALGVAVLVVVGAFTVVAAATTATAAAAAATAAAGFAVAVGGRLLGVGLLGGLPGGLRGGCRGFGFGEPTVGRLYRCGRRGGGWRGVGSRLDVGGGGLRGLGGRLLVARLALLLLLLRLLARLVLAL